MNDYAKGFLGFVIVMCIIGFILIAVDKKKVKKHEGRRINETAILIVSFFFGAFGTFLSMLIFRHKWYKFKFRALVPLFLVINIIIITVAMYFLIDAGVGPDTTIHFGF